MVFYIQPRYFKDYVSPPYNYVWPTGVVDQAVLAAAREHQCDTILDLADAFPQDHFSDLAHLNHKGHEALKNILLPHLLPAPAARSAP